MKPILDQLCYVNFQLSDDYQKREEVIKRSEELKQARFQLKQELNQSQQSLLMKLDDAIADCNALECYEYYSQGVRCGFRLYEELYHTESKQLHQGNLAKNILKKLYQHELDVHRGTDSQEQLDTYNEYDKQYEKVKQVLIHTMGKDEATQLLEQLKCLRMKIQYENNFSDFCKGYQLGVQLTLAGMTHTK